MRLLAALASGLVLAIIAPPVNLAWAHWFSFVPLFWALRAGEHRKNARLGYASGWLAVFVLFFWLIETVIRFSNLPLPLAVLVLVAFSTAFALPYAVIFGSVHWLRERFGVWWVFLTPAVLVAMERLSPALFPYYQGVSQYRTLWTWQLTSVTGVMGLSYLVMLTNTALAEIVYRRREGRPIPWRPLAVVVALFAANIGFGVARSGAVDRRLASAPEVRVALIQENVTMEERMSSSRKAALASWLLLTEKASALHPDLVVWPEGAVPYNPTDPKLAELLGDLAKRGDFDLLVGGGTSEPAPPETGRKWVHHNSCYHFSKQGEITGRYDKMVPLPFGEYIPFSDTFPALKDIIEGPGDFRPGEVPTVFQADGYTFSTPICYEAILASQMWKLASADVFVNITNDAWFGDTASPHQHAMLAAVQATQFGRPLLRIAYTGICFVVEPNGRILFETRPFTEAVAVESMRLLRIETLYLRGGWVFPWLCVLVAGAAGLIGRRRGPPDPPALA